MAHLDNASVVGPQLGRIPGGCNGLSWRQTLHMQMKTQTRSARCAPDSQARCIGERLLVRIVIVDVDKHVLRIVRAYETVDGDETMGGGSENRSSVVCADITPSSPAAFGSYLDREEYPPPREDRSSPGLWPMLQLVSRCGRSTGPTACWRRRTRQSSQCPRRTSFCTGETHNGGELSVLRGLCAWRQDQHGRRCCCRSFRPT